MSAQFTCKAVGQSLNYQWQLNGTNIPGATTDTYSIESSQLSNAGVYALVMTNQLGMTMSRPANLSVLYAITVQPPVLPMQPDQTVDELSQLVVTNTETDVMVPNLTLTYQLLNAPSGASIDGNGVIRWTPALNQAPSTNVFTTIVTDNALPPAAATNTFLVVVLATNQPPVLDLPASWTLVADTPFSEQVLATDPDNPVNSLTFTLGAGAPSGASISPGGLFSWTPSPDQAPSTNLVTIWVSDSLNSVSQSIEIVVYPLNTIQPVLPTQPDRTIFGQVQLVITNTVTDSDGPPVTLTYELLFAPAGATIDSNGIIRWTPLPDQEPSTNFFTTQVTESGMPPLSRRNIFSVVALVSNQAPILEIPDSWTLTGDVAFSQQVVVSDPYEPPTTSLTFSLSGGAPLGATMTPTGLFSWTPSGSQAPSTNPVTICVSDGTSTFCKTIQIIVNQNPLEILSQPLGGSLGIGYDASLSVLARGTTPVSYQWQFNRTNMLGATGATLTLSNAEPAQSGTYSVTVSNQSGAITSNPVSVAIVAIITWENGLPDERSNIPAHLTNVAAIAGGDAFDVALNADGTVVAWGANIFHELDVPADATNIVAIAAGSSHALALRADGTVVTWGTMWPTSVPVPVDLTNAVAVDGTVVAWDDGGGEFTPVPADLTNVVAVSSGQFGTLALKSDGTVEGWLAKPPFDPNLLIGALPSNLTNVVAISAKGDHGLALLGDGTVVAWGTNGLNTVPAGLSGVVAVTGAPSQSLALLRNGSPHVTVQPWDSSVAAGGLATLNAKAVGLQSMNYQWRQNGDDIPGATNENYSIASVEPANAGGYTLLVSNRVGATLSREAKLSVVETVPPVLTQPDDYAVNVGQTVTFANSVVDVYSNVQLTFSLDLAPPGAAINSQTGVFAWRPPVSSAGTTNEVIIRVADNNTPPLSDTKTFWVSVNTLQPASISPSLEGGQLHFILTGTAGPDYILEASNDLKRWTDLQTNSPALMPVDFAGPGLNLSSHRFFRLRLGP